MNEFEPEAVDYESKKISDFRNRALLLSMKASDAADVVEEFGEAHIDGKLLIDAGDVSAMVSKLRHYAEWLQRISDGEAITEEDLQEIEAVLDSVRVKKQSLPKNEMIEVAYLGLDPETGRRTRKRIWATIVTGESEVDLQKLHIDLQSLRTGVVSETNEQGE